MIEQLPESNDLNRKWWVLASLWLLYASFGLVAGSLAPLLNIIRVDLGMSHATMGAALGAWPFVYLGVSAITGKFLDRYGIQIGLSLGALLIGVSGILRAGAQSGLGLWMAVAVFGLGGPFISIGAPKLVTEWFPVAQRGLAVGLYSTASSLGAITALVVADPIRVATGSWRWVMVLFGAVSFGSGLLWVVVSARSPSAQNLAPTPVKSLSLLREPTISRILLLAFMIFFVSHALGGWMPEMLASQMWSSRGAAWLTAAGVAVGVIGSLVIPSRTAPANRPQVLIGLFVAMAIAVWALALSSQVAQVFAVSVVGIARVSTVPMAMLLLMSSRAVPDERMGIAAGLFFTAGEIGGVSGPWVIGIARQNADNFGLSIGILSTVAIAAAIACWVFNKFGYLRHERPGEFR